MFLGHFGVALAAKRLAPRTSLGTLFIAAQFADLLWPVLLLAGVEHVRIDAAAKPMPLLFDDYPYSHSLVALAAWGALLAGAYFAATRYARGALVVAALVVSHWLLDVVVHRPDLPLAPGGATEVGLFLWRSTAAAMTVELSLFAFGLLLYLRARGAAVRAWSVWVLSALLVAVYLLDRLGGGVPPSVAAIAWVGQAQWLFVAAAYWIDRQRPGRAPLAPASA